MAAQAVTKDMLLSELQNLLRLTAFEQTIATVRRTQAASTAVADELAANREKAVERSQLLADAVRQVGGVPDVVGAALGKAGAFVQTQVNQVQTLQGALLGDLALEHQLRERTRYARTLAESLGYYQLIPVFERLDVAHTATIEWLEARLTEVGRTGTSAIAATPVQALVGCDAQGRAAAVRRLRATVNRGTSLLRRGASTAAETVTSAAGTAAETAREGVQTAARTAGEAAETAVDTVTDAASTAAGRRADGRLVAGTVAEGAQTAAQTVSQGASRPPRPSARRADRRRGDVAGRREHRRGRRGRRRATEQATQTEVEQVLDLTDVDEDKPPFAGYASLSGDSVMRHVRDTEDVEHLREILAFEQAHKNRKGVVGALNERLTELAGASRSPPRTTRPRGHEPAGSRVVRGMDENRARRVAEALRRHGVNASLKKAGRLPVRRIAVHLPDGREAVWDARRRAPGSRRPSWPTACCAASCRHRGLRATSPTSRSSTPSGTPTTTRPSAPARDRARLSAPPLPPQAASSLLPWTAAVLASA
jgi:bacterioferritin (cytochrome b1)